MGRSLHRLVRFRDEWVILAAVLPMQVSSGAENGLDFRRKSLRFKLQGFA